MFFAGRPEQKEKDFYNHRMDTLLHPGYSFLSDDLLIYSDSRSLSKSFVIYAPVAQLDRATPF